MLKISDSEYSKEYRSVDNSILAYTNLVDCSNKTFTEIENQSYHQLSNCPDELFFVETKDTMSFIKNTSRLIGAITSLGGSYNLALQKKHYLDIYETLYKPSIKELECIQNKTKIELTAIGELLKRYNNLIMKVERVLNKVPTNRNDIKNTKSKTLSRMHKFNKGFSQSISTGFGGIIGGTTAVGAWGVVSIVGSASTGTAISALSGVAATNATLAWFGGGSLAVGGAGMTGGFWILGGIVAAPMIYFSTKSSYKKANEIKHEKFKIVAELEKHQKLKYDAVLQLQQLTQQHKYVSSIIKKIEPEIEAELMLLTSNSPLWFRIFGGKMNEKQQNCSDKLENLICESLKKLGIN